MPPDDPAEKQFRQWVLASQSIAGALAAALVSFLIVVLVIFGAPVAGRPSFATYIAIGFFAIALVVSVIVPRWITSDQLRRIANGTWKPPAKSPSNADFSSGLARMMSVFQTQAIVRMATLEGAGFCALAMYFTEPHWLNLAVALVALALLVVQFPTRGRIEDWLERQLAALQSLHQSPELRRSASQ
jgi:hypothetical protein